MLEMLIKLFMFEDWQCKILYIPAAIIASMAIAGILVYLRKAQIVIWTAQFFGSLWVVSGLPYQTAAIFIVSLSAWLIIGAWFHVLYLRYRYKKITEIFHPDWS